MHFDVVIVGAGPGGLSCAKSCSRQGLKTLVLEKQNQLGKKVCAGGITWNGLIKNMETDISEKKFAKQYIVTKFQRVVIEEEQPIIATVNRQTLGRFMAEKAYQAGAEIREGTKVTSLEKNSLTYFSTSSKTRETIHFSYLVGADGSSSIVRRHLKLPVVDFGIGLHYQLPWHKNRMEWHLDSSLFGSGYSWIFPHKDSASIGAYAHASAIGAKALKNNFHYWCDKNNIQLDNQKCQAERINFDYRGYRFDNFFLIGDSAGLASGLTGEGIYPAIVSGDCVGSIIASPTFKPNELERLISNNIKHKKMVKLATKSKLLSTLLSEIIVLCLRSRFVGFDIAEMAR